MKESDHRDLSSVIINEEIDKLRAKLRKRHHRAPSQKDLETARQELGPDPSVVESVSNWRQTKAERGQSDRPDSS
jgi:hypothetical protein